MNDIDAAHAAGIATHTPASIPFITYLLASARPSEVGVYGVEDFVKAKAMFHGQHKRLVL